MICRLLLQLTWFLSVLVLFCGADFTPLSAAPRKRGNYPSRNIQQNRLRKKNHESGEHRGVSYGFDWSQRDHHGQISIPWSVSGNFGKARLARVKFAMESLERDVGCVTFPYVPHEDLKSTKWKNGLIFIYQEELADVGCYSMVGQLDGFIDGSIFTDIRQTGAPEGWQMVALADECDGTSESTVHHEVMHALGFSHEHARPDRDEFLDINMEVIMDPSQFDKVDEDHWHPDPFKFDLSSVMLYCSMCSSAYSDRPGMTLKDGTTFETPIRASTIDVLEIQWLYCEHNYTDDLTHCGNKDELDQNRPILTSRICDGYVDCPNGIDEDGSMGECEATERAGQTECCHTYLVDGVEFSFSGMMDSKPKFYANSSGLFLLYIGVMDTWYISVTDKLRNFYFYDQHAKPEGDCPPMLGWYSGTVVTCKSNGTNERIDHPKFSIDAIYGDSGDIGGRTHFGTDDYHDSSSDYNSSDSSSSSSSSSYDYYEPPKEDEIDSRHLGSGFVVNLLMLPLILALIFL